MADGSRPGWYYRQLVSGLKPVTAYRPCMKGQKGPTQTREHSVMSVYVRGMGWVDIKPWRQK